MKFGVKGRNISLMLIICFVIGCKDFFKCSNSDVFLQVNYNSVNIFNDMVDINFKKCLVSHLYMWNCFLFLLF